MKVLSLFSGIGAFEKALTNIGINYDVVNYCEIDKYASKAYSLIHNISEEKNLKDIKKIKINNLEDFDLMTWGFPCTNFSIAGKKEGMKFKCNCCGHEFKYDDVSFYEKLKNKDICPNCHSDDINALNQSALYFEGYRILFHKKPKISIIENVKRLVGTPEFILILKDLETLGYNTYYKILNAKDYGVPQNRERIFIISIRKDINIDFKFKEGFDSGLRLIDFMDIQVNKKYYIKEELSKEFIQQHMGDFLNNTSEKNNIDTLGMLSFKGTESIRRVYNNYGISPTLTTMQGGQRQPKVMYCTANTLRFIGGFPKKKKWLENNKDFSRNFRQGNRVYDNRYIATALTSSGGGLGRCTGIYMFKENYQIQKNKKIYKKYKFVKLPHKKYTLSYKNFGIRRLTPKECFLLMGFSIDDFKLLNEFSDTQLYKMAGNSIVVNILEVIFNNIF